MKSIFLSILFSGLLSSIICHASNVNDFCKADLKGPDSPAGYHCLPPDTVTASDFKYSFLRANLSVPVGTTASPAFVNDFPMLNGLGISAARVEIESGGFFPMHTHPGGHEIIIIDEGEMTVGIVTPTKAYVNTLKPGDVMVLPQSQLHFLVNSGKGKTVGYAIYGSANPRTQFIFQSLFANNVTSDLIARTTFLDVAQVMKLKARFGGS